MRTIFVLVLLAVVILVIIVGAFYLIRRWDTRYERELEEHRLDVQRRRQEIVNDANRHAYEEERRWDKRLKGDT